MLTDLELNLKEIWRCMRFGGETKSERVFVLSQIKKLYENLVEAGNHFGTMVLTSAFLSLKFELCECRFWEGERGFVNFFFFFL